MQVISAFMFPAAETMMWATYSFTNNSTRITISKLERFLRDPGPVRRFGRRILIGITSLLHPMTKKRRPSLSSSRSDEEYVGRGRRSSCLAWVLWEGLGERVVIPTLQVFC